VLHNGNFHGGYVASALDAAGAALVPAAALSTARLANLMDPAITGGTRFLAGGPAGSSGLLILEYVAHAALAEIRHNAGTAPVGPTTLSLGTEDHASFSTQAAHRITAAVGAYPTVLACELVAAVRALRMSGTRPPEPLLALFERACAVLDPDVEDRSLEDDIEAATELLRSP
jgi:histidine ammonia-lyase